MVVSGSRDCGPSCEGWADSGSGHIFQGTADGQSVSRWAGLGRVLERPLLVQGGVQDAEVLDLHGGCS